MKPLLSLLIGILLGMSVFAQKKELIQDKETILARAAETFDASLRPGGSLYEPVIKENLIGIYVLQVSFGDKGDITSVFVESAEGGNIPSQNRFKDLVAKGRMPFKMPKDRHYRLTHTFDLNAIQR